MIATLSELRLWGRKQLAPLPTAALEVEVLLAAVLEVEALTLLLQPERPISSTERDAFFRAVSRRLRSEPIAYILGKKEFFSREFAVCPAVLVPRPETELLVEQAIQPFAADLPLFDVIDIGTGSGNIIVTIAAELSQKFGREYLSRGRFFGFDVSADALAVATRNASAHEMTVIEFAAGSLLDQIAPLRPGTALRLVVSNPPYIAAGVILPADVMDFEPHTALFAGTTGLEVIERLVTQWAGLPHKAEQEVLVLEIGHGQDTDVQSLLEMVGCRKHTSFRDIQGIPRVIVAESS